MKKNLLPALLAASVISTATYADHENSDSIRFGFGYSSTAIAIEDPVDDIVQTETSFPFSVVYQSQGGFYGGLSHTKATVDEVKIGSTTYDVDFDYDINAFEVGYRTKFGTSSNYVGVGFQRASISKLDDDSNILSVFTEKDTDARYGRISFGYESARNLDAYGFAGTHIWFLSSPFGIGLNWAIGSGDFDSGEEFATARFGVNLMYRLGM